jgi:hypothetical protein
MAGQDCWPMAKQGYLQNYLQNYGRRRGLDCRPGIAYQCDATQIDKNIDATQIDENFNAT